MIARGILEWFELSAIPALVPSVAGALLRERWRGDAFDAPFEIAVVDGGPDEEPGRVLVAGYKIPPLREVTS